MTGETWTYTYDAGGMRTQRTNGSTTYKYIYNGGSLSQMTVGSNTLYFTYGANGTPLTVTYNGTVYYYVTNIQGDVIAILNGAGAPVTTYTYDAWGKPLSTTGSMATTLGTLNPLRYRGYVYDQEHSLYYLQSRYYNPTWGRFINADALVSTGQGPLGNNMFAYCLNNPVNMTDITGNWPSWNDIKEKLEETAEKMGNALEKLAQPFEAQVGFGMGLGGQISNTVTAEFSRDTYVGIDNGMLVTGNLIVAEASLLDSDISVGNTYDHRVEEGGVRVSHSASSWDGPFDMMNYPDVTHGNEFALGPITVNSEGELLLSFSVSFHLVYGGHASVAYNLTELFRIIKGESI